jgi:hypothetical protein
MMDRLEIMTNEMQRESAGVARRSGLSLLEVLISMFVLLVGLLGVAALIPAGKSQINDANKLSTSSAVGNLAYRDLKTRGILQPLANVSGGTFNRWGYCDGSGTAHSIDASSGYPPLPSTLALLPHFVGPPAPVFRGYAIDPLSVAAHLIAGTQDKVYQFPANWIGPPPASIPPTPAMLRLTLADSAGAALSAQLADLIFRSADDIKLTLDVRDRDRPAQQDFDKDSTGATTLRRASYGDYSWLATLVPPEGSLPAIPDVHDAWKVSVVVFYKRRPQGIDPLDTSNPPSERMVNAKLVGGGLGGGDAILYTDNANPHYLDVNRGDWLMLGPPTPPSTPPPAPPPEHPFRWYKVISTDETIPFSSYAGPTLTQPSGTKTYVRYVTLEGEDWNTDAYGDEVTASLFEGAIGVVEKDLRLETPSEWSK